MKITIDEVRKMVRNELSEGITIRFRPDEVCDFVSIAVEFSGGRYEYDPMGSTVSFSGREFSHFIKILKQGLDDTELIEPEERAQIQSAMNHVMQQLPSA